MTLTNLIGYGFAGMVTFSCIRHVARGGLKNDFQVFKGHSPKVWAEVVAGDLLALAVLVFCGILTAHLPAFIKLDFWPTKLQNPLLWSWLDIFADKNSLGQGSNQMVAGALIPYFGAFFVLLLFVNLPRLAEEEEFAFRDGTKNWWHAIPRSLGFGLMHMIVGVPLWLGLALAFPGLWFTRQYFKGGVSRSTMAHALYNMVIASGLFVYAVMTSFHLG